MPQLLYQQANKSIVLSSVPLTLLSVILLVFVPVLLIRLAWPCRLRSMLRLRRPKRCLHVGRQRATAAEKPAIDRPIAAIRADLSPPCGRPVGSTCGWSSLAVSFSHRSTGWYVRVQPHNPIPTLPNPIRCPLRTAQPPQLSPSL